MTHAGFFLHRWTKTARLVRMLKDIAGTFRSSSLPDSEIEFAGDIPFDEVASYRERALAHLAEHIELPGFRKGHVPLSMVEKKVGDIAILEEAVELLVRDFYPILIAAKKIDPVGRPEIKITKLAPQNPVGLSVTTGIFPEITLPDYKKITKGVPDEKASEPTDEDVEKAIEAIRASRGTLKEGAEKPDLPELTDEFVRTLGTFEDVASFKTKLKEHLGVEKEREAKDKRRSTIVEAIIEKTKVIVPKVFIESELEKIIAQMKDDIGRMGMEWNDYLSRLKKTEEDVRSEFRDSARKRAILQLALNAIAEKENITVPAEDIKREADHILENFKTADRERVHIYAESVLKNEKTLSMLESEG